MTEAQAAHLRLISQLPVRTHEARSRYGVETRGGDTTGVRKIRTDSEGKGIASRITVDGKTYPSIAAVCRALSVGHDTVYKWLDSGRAVRAMAAE